MKSPDLAMTHCSAVWLTTCQPSCVGLETRNPCKLHVAGILGADAQAQAQAQTRHKARVGIHFK
ncbi:MAG: hypothetical protein ABL878_06435 [Burkholderiales bacterium]